MRLYISDIKDYLRCPLYYKFRAIDQIPSNRTINDFYRDYVRLSIFYYYFSTIERKIKSFESILRKWESLWFSNEMTTMFSEFELKEYSNKAVLLLTSFYKRISDENIMPIAVNFTYDIIFPGTKNIQVVGDIDLIGISNDRTRVSKTDIIFFTMREDKSDEFILKNDIELTLASLAFRNSFKEKEDRIVLRSITSEEESYSSRTGGDFIRAEKIARNIAAGIDGKVFYPAPNKINCSKCNFKLLCLNEKAVP